MSRCPCRETMHGQVRCSVPIRQPGVDATQTLALKAKPDFEMPGDRNKDNIYEVTVVASDGTVGGHAVGDGQGHRR